MASTYLNNLRLEEIGTGEQSGTWGDTTNTNLKIIGQAVAWGTRAIANASTDNITIGDGALDADRCLGLKLTGGGQACTVTLLPNTSSKTWFMYNATAAALTFTCGSGANVIIPAGQTKVIATDGLGSGGVVHDLLTAVNLAGITQTAAVTTQGTLTVGVDDTGYDVKFFGATSGKSLLWDESADSLIVTGTTTLVGTTNLDVIDVDGAANFAADVTFANGADIITASAGTSNFRAGVNAGNSIASGGNYNTVVGDEAGTAISTGDNNTLIGYVAGDAISTSSANTAVGSYAMTSMTDGADNVAVGTSALDVDTKGSKTVAVGRDALGTQNFTSATDTFNTAVGFKAGFSITTGTHNTLIGAQAAGDMTDADYNTAVGFNAMTTNQLGSRSVAIGYEALKTQNPSSAADMYNVGIGFNAGQQITTGDRNVAVGSTALDACTTGQYNTAVGNDALTSLTTAANITAVGISAGAAITTGASNTAIGARALAATTTGANNTATGFEALKANTTGASNCAFGYISLVGNTTGVNNTSMGFYSLVSNTTGTDNNGFGYGTLLNCTTGYNNVALGGGASYLASSLNALTTGYRNVGCGVGAGAAITTGSNNVAVGDAALYNCTTEGQNIAVGGSSLSACVTGYNNVAVGHVAGSSVTTGHNNIFIGRDAGITGSPGGNITSQSNYVVLGDENIAYIRTAVGVTANSDQRDKTDFTALDLGLDFVKALAPVTYKWDKRSKYGDKTADGYDLNDQTPDGTHKEDWLDIGFKAQEVEALEQAAGYNKNNKTNLLASITPDGKSYGLTYEKFIPILVKAIQEQNSLIEALTARVATLEG